MMSFRPSDARADHFATPRQMVPMFRRLRVQGTRAASFCTAPEAVLCYLYIGMKPTGIGISYDG